jgi:hypothetical protein
MMPSGPDGPLVQRSPFDGVRLVIASPVDGMPEASLAATGYQFAVASILAEHRDAALIDPRRLCYPADIVRARCRAVSTARLRGDVTHILWLDTDVVPKPGFLGAMLATGYDWIGCPYPRKRIHWDRVRPEPHEEAEWHAYDYAYHFSSGDASSAARVECVNGCIPVERLSIGCTLTSMRALNAVWDYFADADWFTDVVDGRHTNVVSIFGLLMSNTGLVRGERFRALFSEDYSVCERYNVVREACPSLGFAPIQMLVTHPADHVGGHLYRASAEGLVYAR